MNHKQKSESLFKKGHLVFKEDGGWVGWGEGGGLVNKSRRQKQAEFPGSM